MTKFDNYPVDHLISGDVPDEGDETNWHQYTFHWRHKGGKKGTDTVWLRRKADLYILLDFWNKISDDWIYTSD